MVEHPKMIADRRLVEAMPLNARSVRIIREQNNYLASSLLRSAQRPLYWPSHSCAHFLGCNTLEQSPRRLFAHVSFHRTNDRHESARSHPMRNIPDHGAQRSPRRPAIARHVQTLDLSLSRRTNTILPVRETFEEPAIGFRDAIDLIGEFSHLAPLSSGEMDRRYSHRIFSEFWAQLSFAGKNRPSRIDGLKCATASTATVIRYWLRMHLGYDRRRRWILPPQSLLVILGPVHHLGTPTLHLGDETLVRRSWLVPPPCRIPISSEAFVGDNRIVSSNPYPHERLRARRWIAAPQIPNEIQPMKRPKSTKRGMSVCKG
jgi:hypothetical protein